MRTFRKSQQGLSLVELMVALLLGVILTSGVISVFITSKTSYNMNSGLGQVQEEGRFALQILQPIMVMAGNTGCAHAPTITGIINNADEVYTMADPVYGFDYTGTGTGDSFDDSTAPGYSNAPTVDNTTSNWNPDLSTSPLLAAALNNKAVKYSDVLMVHEMLGDSVPILSTSSTTSVVYDSSYAYAPSFSSGEILMTSVCSPAVAEVFQAGTVGSGAIAIGSGGTPGNSASALTQHYENLTGKVFVAPAQTYVFFVGKGTDQSTSLYEVKLEADNSNGKVGQLGTPVEIVPGVENMQVLYGVYNSAAQTLQYVTADNVGAGNWSSVISVRIALLVHSDSNAVDQAPSAVTTIHMLGTSSADSFDYQPYPDRRMRRYFAETFSVRNSLP